MDHTRFQILCVLLVSSLKSKKNILLCVNVSLIYFLQLLLCQFTPYRTQFIRHVNIYMYTNLEQQNHSSLSCHQFSSALRFHAWQLLICTLSRSTLWITKETSSYFKKAYSAVGSYIWTYIHKYHTHSWLI